MPILRYRLDDLGWFQFEWLVQSLLKAELGPGVESWGGRGDHGIDAYSRESLNFPSRHISKDGPFIFQVKFVENANAAGADFDDLLIKSVQQEIIRIQRRVQTHSWHDPQHYALLTNAVPSASTRVKIKTLFNEVISDASFHCLGGNDLCDLLDRQTTLRRSFPQLLSLRDLDQLIGEAVNKATLEKSRTAVDFARDLVPVFVPTQAYRKALKTLDDHRFAVLEGPPEMGKTCIAWMIAFAYLMQDWQAIYCTGPEDFFSNFISDSKQIFVADDAFGRTEYDPTRGRQWERELGLVLKRLDPKHWLIWTSRKHILERALHAMDLHGEATHTPRLAAVLVDAGSLSVQEKALILYRHAKSAVLEAKAKYIVQNYAFSIVNDTSFTPERIRRFVSDALPEIIQAAGTDITSPPIKERLASEIREAIRNPTERMQKTFRSLEIPYKWFLVGLLEAGDTCDVETLKTSYLMFCPSSEQKQFETVLEELTEAFVKVYHSDRTNEQTSITWMHPSYRDLVIGELIVDRNLNDGFLTGMSLQGIKLALSGTGGSQGDRLFPFVTSPRSWQLLEDRCLSLVRNGQNWEIRQLLEVIVDATQDNSDRSVTDQLHHICSVVCREIRNKWDSSNVILNGRLLEAYCKASSLVTPLPSMPQLDVTWNAVKEAMDQKLDDCQSMGFISVDPLEEWAELVEVIKENEPRFLRQTGFPEKYVGQAFRFIELVESELNDDSTFDSPDEYRSEAYRLNSIVNTLDKLSSLGSSIRQKYELLKVSLEGNVDRLVRHADEMESEEPEMSDDLAASQNEKFDIQSLFADL